MKASVTGYDEAELSRDQVLAMYRAMLLARRIDERMWLLNRAGKIPFVISCQGQEAAQVGAAFALAKGKDLIFPYYRDLAVCLVHGMTARDAMLAAFARRQDPASGGKQMPNHWGKAATRIFSNSSPVTTHFPHAVGAALAARMLGEDTVAYASCGEGSSNQGDFHEALNFAGVHRLGCVFHVANNRYAISVPLAKQLPVEDVAVRAEGYGMPGVIVDGSDVLAVYRAFSEAVQRARQGEGPSLIESKCVRLTPHSSDDDDRTYRPPGELDEARQNDPLVRTQAMLLQGGLLSAAEDRRLAAEVAAEVDDATDYAEQAPQADPDFALEHVYGG